jgi:kynurenine formamidase
MKIKKIIDLTHNIEGGMPIFPGDPSLAIERVSTIATRGYNLSKITMGSHNGTHFDAPLHFVEGGVGVDQVPLKLLIGDAVVLDLTYLKPGQPVTLNDLKKFDKKIKRGDIVLLCTGMSKLWGDPKFLTNYPFLTQEVAEWLVKKGVKSVGMDWLSIEQYGNAKAPVHHILLSKGVPIIESLANLEKIKGRRIFFVCLPIKLKDVDGAPARAVAVEFRGR